MTPEAGEKGTLLGRKPPIALHLLPPRDLIRRTFQKVSQT